MRWWSQRLFYLKNKFPFTMAKSPVKLCASGHLKYNSRQTSLSLWCPCSECEAGSGRDSGGTGTSVTLVRPCYPSWKLRRCDNQGSPDNWGETSVSFLRHTSRGLSFLLIPPPPLSSRLCHLPCSLNTSLNSWHTVCAFSVPAVSWTCSVPDCVFIQGWMLVCGPEASTIFWVGKPL